jgi:hypothetical protein
VCMCTHPHVHTLESYRVCTPREGKTKTDYTDDEVQSWLTDDDSLVRAIRGVMPDIDDMLPVIISELAGEFGHFDNALYAVRSGWLVLH